MTRDTAHTRGIELEEAGWEFYMGGKKPFHTYFAKKDGDIIKASSTTSLVEKIDIHLNTKKQELCQEQPVN
jgi:hypothetical protein